MFFCIPYPHLTLYQNVAKLLRAFANIANEMPDAGYSAQDVDSIRSEVAHFEKVRDEVKLASGDLVEMKRFEPAMRHLLDRYIRADDKSFSQTNRVLRNRHGENRLKQDQQKLAEQAKLLLGGDLG